MQQSYNQIGDYFGELASRHKGIQTYCRYELDELLDMSISIPGFPALVLEGFDFDYGGSMTDNVLKNRNGAFCLVDKCDVTDARKRTDVLERLEIIGEQILMKMVDDKRKGNPLLTSFDIGSAEGVHFVNPAMGYVFCRINFSFKTKIAEDLSVWQ